MRLQLTKKTDQALRAALVLGHAGGRVKGSALADQVGTSAGWLPQIVQPLVGQGWVSSTTGPNGGYMLEVELGHLDVLRLIEAVEGSTDTGHCVLEDRACGSAPEPCALHEPWLRARASLMRELESISLAELALPTGPFSIRDRSHGKEQP
ncbi:MAG: Rrf2 family transcriptional regulator [Acidimicrobiales bacterium]|nr:Rrf2 family transcriptional regulator [Acidimicrobiales bacterium]